MRELFAEHSKLSEARFVRRATGIKRFRFTETNDPIGRGDSEQEPEQRKNKAEYQIEISTSLFRSVSVIN